MGSKTNLAKKALFGVMVAAPVIGILTVFGSSVAMSCFAASSAAFIASEIALFVGAGVFAFSLAAILFAATVGAIARYSDENKKKKELISGSNNDIVLTYS